MNLLKSGELDRLIKKDNLKLSFTKSFLKTETSENSMLIESDWQLIKNPSTMYAFGLDSQSV